MSQDIVSQMVNEMGVSPGALQQMSDQSQGYANANPAMQQGMPPPGQPGQGMPMQPGQPMQGMQQMQPGQTMQPSGQPAMSQMDIQNMSPEQQMMYLQSIQQNGQMPQQTQQQYQQQQDLQIADDNSSQSDSTISGENVDTSFDMANYGIPNSDGNLVDQILEKIKLPIAVMVLVFLVCLPQFNNQFDRLLPTKIIGNNYYYIASKAVLVGLVFFGLQLIL